MNTSELQQTIFQILHELTAIPTSQLHLDSNLRTDVNLDSVSALELIGMMDEEFGIEIDLYEVREVRTIRDIVDLAQHKTNS